MSFSSKTFSIPSQKTVHLREEAMRMVLSRMPVLTSLKVKNIKIIIAKFIFRIIMIIPILWMRIRMILQLLTSLEVLSQDDVYSQHWYYQCCQLNTGDVDLNPQGVFMRSWVRLLPDEEDERDERRGKGAKSWHNIFLKAYGIFRMQDEIF